MHEKRKLIKLTIRLHEGDREFLQQTYPNVTYTEIVRRLITQFISRTKASIAKSEITADVNLDAVENLEDLL